MAAHDAGREVARPRSVVVATVALLGVATLLLIYGAFSLYALVQLATTDATALPPLNPTFAAMLLVPVGIGLGSAIAGIGLLRRRPWAALAGAVMAAALGGAGLLLLWIFWAERDLPGSFAALYVPPGVLALLTAAVIGYGAAAHRAWLAAHGRR